MFNNILNGAKTVSIRRIYLEPPYFSLRTQRVSFPVFSMTSRSSLACFITPVVCSSLESAAATRV